MANNFRRLIPQNTFYDDATRPHVLGDQTFLSQITPNYEYKQIDDGMMVDDQVKFIIHIYSQFGKSVDLNPMWGLAFIRNIIKSLHEYRNMNVVFVHTMKAQNSQDVVKKQDEADVNAGMSTANKSRSQFKLKQQREDLNQISIELERDSASYIDNSLKYIITTDSIEQFDTFYADLERQLTTAIPSLVLTTSEIPPFEDLRNILEDPKYNIGRRIQMTSTELAGEYNLVSSGMEDPNGIHCGEQVGDINNSPVLWDPKLFATEAIVAANNDPYRLRDRRLNRLEQPQFKNAKGVDIWVNSIIRRSIRKDTPSENTQVFTLALAPLTLSNSLTPITKHFEMSRGYINPFEMFGIPNKEEKVAFESNILKWEIMFRQLYRTTIQEDNKNITSKEMSNAMLSEIQTLLENLYIQHNMWTRKKNGGKLGYRNLGIPHETIPDLDDFIEILERRKLEIKASKSDTTTIEEIAALTYRLKRAAMFGNKTSPQIDHIGQAKHVLFDFSTSGATYSNTQLLQFIVGFSAIINKAKQGDIVIIHGADRIVSLTQSYIRQQIDLAIQKGVRFIYTYVTVSAMLTDAKFNRFSSADYVLVGGMNSRDAEQYDNLLDAGKTIPTNIKTSLDVNTTQNYTPYRYYLRRNYSHVCFNADPLI